jgi:hypothetical protein
VRVSPTIGWQSAFPEILAAAKAARSIAPFDERARARLVAEAVTAARKFPLWPALAAVVAFVLPNGWMWGTATFVVYGLMIHKAMQRGAVVGAQLQEETRRLRAANAHETEHLRSTLASADNGFPNSLRILLKRWHDRRPDALRQFVIEVGGDGSHYWMLGGHGVNRDEIPTGTPRVGRGGRTVFDKRKASEIDEDLAELNASGVLSVLIALCSGPSPQRVAVRLDVLNPATGARIPWVTMVTTLSHSVIDHALSSHGTPVEVLRRLGADIGRCRNQQMKPAAEPVVPTRLATGVAEARALSPSSRDDASPSPPSRIATSDSPLDTPLATPPPARPAMTAQPVPPRISPAPSSPPSQARPTSPLFPVVPPLRAHDNDFDARLVEGTWHQVTVAGRAIPRPPPGFPGSSIGLSSATPKGSNVAGQFSVVARKYAAYPGVPNAPFVPFKAYYSTYGDMSEQQMRFYFRWRHLIRAGDIQPTDLSYIFVHTYELLHLVGAEDAVDAGAQLERLRSAYRAAFPQLDGYLVRWTADLYAAEVGADAAITFIQRAVAQGTPAADELLLVTDQYWAVSDYLSMPRAGMALLLGERRLGDNKFYREHNTEVEGRPWVEGGYREAIMATDRAFRAKHGKSLRDATVEDHGLRTIRREAFQGAVYDWKRKHVVLGKVPALTDTSRTVVLYRNAVRYAENILRRERAFPGRLRGIQLDPALAAALDQAIEGYIRTTKPRARVTIDVARVKNLARESADIRARLLDGVSVDERPATNHSPGATLPTEAVDLSASAAAEAAPPDGAPAAGLLTDLAAVQAAVGALSSPSRALLSAIVAAGWQLPADHARLTTAVGDVLIAPLVDEVNEHALEMIGDVLLVHEGELLLLQEDYRDEVYFVLKGNLEGFSSAFAGAHARSVQSRPAPVARLRDASAEAESFGPLEVQVLTVIAEGGADSGRRLTALASTNATTRLLLVDRVNECGLASAHADIILDGDAVPPAIIEDAQDFVQALLARTRSTTPAPQASEALR